MPSSILMAPTRADVLRIAFEALEASTATLIGSCAAEGRIGLRIEGDCVPASTYCEALVEKDDNGLLKISFSPIKEPR